MKEYKKSVRAITTVLLLLTYFGIMIYAGHGAGSIGLLMILGFSAWILPVISGWLGIFLIISSWFLENPEKLIRCEFISLMALGFSWVVFISNSEKQMISLLFSIPFLTLVVIKVIFLVRYRKGLMLKMNNNSLNQDAQQVVRLLV